METLLLRDQEILPTDRVLEKVLVDSYSVFKELMEIITDTKYGLIPQWNYYKDGKAWFCKVSYKKKTVFWLSVWDKFFKTAFYFTEKTRSGIDKLEIDESIKEDFNLSKPIGKLIPLVIYTRKKDQINDILRIIVYKKNLL
jgi:hypothetical protein